MSQEIQLWNKVLSGALSMPGVKVDRDSFLYQELRPFCKEEDLQRAIKNPVAVIPEKQLTKIANSCINNQTFKVTAISTVAGIPGGIAMFGTIPGDIIQYHFHVFVIAQKLAYLYGLPDLRDEKGNFSETSQDLITLFVGVMMGVSAANKIITAASRSFAIQVAKRLPKQALTKTFWYPILVKIARWLGVKLTKEGFGKALGKVIPIVGGVISGGLTYAAFKPSCKRLQNKLKSQMYEIQHESEKAEEEYAKYDEV